MTAVDMTETVKHSPNIVYRLLPVSGRSPVILLKIEAIQPPPKRIVIILDLSDSCHNIEKQLAELSKLLKDLPSSWPVDIYRLSNSTPIGKDGLTLFDFLESKNFPGDLCNDRSSIESGSQSGSFLRPCLEGIHSRMNAGTLEKGCLVISLGDGDFSDFGRLPVPDSLDIVSIITGGSGGPYESSRPDIVPCFHFQDHKLDRVIKQYQFPFWGPVKIQVTSPLPPTHAVYRVESDGQLTNCTSLENQVFNLSTGPCYILIDPEQSIPDTLKCRVISCTFSTDVVLNGIAETQVFDTSLEKSITEQFSGDLSSKGPIILLNVKQGSDLFETVCNAYKSALELAQKTEAWIDECGTIIIDAMQGITELCDEGGKPKCDGMILIQCQDLASVVQVMAVSLLRSRNPALHLKHGDKIGDFTVEQDVTVDFVQKMNRWVLTTEGEPFELNYYGSEVIKLPLVNNQLQSPKVIFSGNLR